MARSRQNHMAKATHKTTRTEPAALASGTKACWTTGNRACHVAFACECAVSKCAFDGAQGEGGEGERHKAESAPSKNARISVILSTCCEVLWVQITRIPLARPPPPSSSPLPLYSLTLSRSACTHPFFLLPVFLRAVDKQTAVCDFMRLHGSLEMDLGCRR